MDAHYIGAGDAVNSEYRAPRLASRPRHFRNPVSKGIWYGVGASMIRPTLSVVLPNYNDAPTLGAALEAILGQSQKPDEVIVVDDGSTDGSPELLEGYARREPSLRVLRNEQNRGALASFARGLKSASGDCLYLASANDRVLPGFFEKSLSLLARHPQAGLCCGDFSVFFDSDTAVVRRLRWSAEEAYLPAADLALTIRKKSGYISSSASIVRRTSFSEAGGLNPDLKSHADWFVFHVIGFRQGVCYVPEPLAAWRGAQPGSMTAETGIWPSQREVIARLLELLDEAAYRDVRSHFQSSAILSFLPFILRALRDDAAHREFRSALLVRRALKNSIKRFLLASAPRAFRRAFGGVQGNRAVLEALRDEGQAGTGAR